MQITTSGVSQEVDKEVDKEVDEEVDGRLEVVGWWGGTAQW